MAHHTGAAVTRHPATWIPAPSAGMTTGKTMRILEAGEAAMIDTLTEDQVAQFNADGFLILPNLIERAEAEEVAARFEPLFKGKFETGLYPDEWNWQEGRD